MHELSVAMSILDIASNEGERQGGGRVAAIHLKLGPLSGVAKESLRSAYQLAREASALSAAELVIEDAPLVVACLGCRARRTLPSPQELRCPVCGTPTPDVIHGREMQLVALEIES